MPAAPSVAWLHGRIVDFAAASVPLDDRGLQFGESLYEVVPVTAGKARLLAEHAERMRRAADILEIGDAVPDDASWHHVFAALQEREHLLEGLLYAQVTGGSAPRRHLPAPRPAPTFFAYLQSFRFPRADAVDKGMALISMIDPRWARCDLKTTMLLPAVLAKREADRRRAGEAVFVAPDGLVHEGASSNVFAVEGRTIVTPRQTTSVLPGITRPTVAALARSAGLDVNDEEMPLERLLSADEAFVTSTTFLVMPVTSIDERTIGDGKPGPIARDLAVRLRAQLDLD